MRLALDLQGEAVAKAGARRLTQVSESMGINASITVVRSCVVQAGLGGCTAHVGFAKLDGLLQPQNDVFLKKFSLRVGLNAKPKRKSCCTRSRGQGPDRAGSAKALYEGQDPGQRGVLEGLPRPLHGLT